MVYTIRVYYLKVSCANLCANRTKNGGRRLPDVKHECYGKLSVKSVLKLHLKDFDCPIKMLYLALVVPNYWPKKGSFV